MVLATAGASFTDAMKLAYSVVGVDQEQGRGSAPSVTKSCRPEKRPVSSLLGVAGLLRPGMLIEIEAPVELPDGGDRRPGSPASTRGDVVWNADGSVVLGIALSGAPSSPALLRRRQSSRNTEAVTALT